MISSVGKELLSNVVNKNDTIPSLPTVEFQRNDSIASSTLTDSFEKINFPNNNHLAIPQLNIPTKLSSSTGSLFKRFQKQKLGHRKVDEHGQVTFKTIETSQICESLQLGIRCSISRSNVPERDVLMKDFVDIEITDFPSKGTNTMPAHKFDDFKFKTYAPNAFRYFRELFGIPTEDFLVSVGHKELRELSNPGASGSVFYKTMDDRFIIKTVQQKESHFLRKLLPKYFMNLHQNPDTLLPKFYGLYCYICGVHRVRVVVMNNLLPSKIPVHLKFDLKGSSYKRKASKLERSKTSPTLKDLDFVEFHPKGIFLEPATYDSLMKTIKRDCTVLESFNIMDYSFLIGIHFFDYKNQNKDSGTSTLSKSNSKENDNETENEGKKEDIDTNKDEVDMAAKVEVKSDVEISINEVKIEISEQDNVDSGVILNKDASDEEETSFQSPKPRLHLQTQQSAPATLRPNQNSFSNISLLDQQMFLNSPDQLGNPGAGMGICTYLPPDVISGRTADGKNLLIFCGIIDILQSYELNKKLEHSFKSIITDGRTISVTRPDYYATRFQDFLGNQVFKKDRSLSDNLEISPSMTKNLSFIQRKINTPLLNPNFLGFTNSQLLNYSMFSGSSNSNTFDNQSTYSFQSSIRSAPAANNNFYKKLQPDFRNAQFMNFNQALQDELTYRRNNLTLNTSLTKGRLLSRHGYLESLGSSAFDDRSMFGSSTFDDTMSNFSYSIRTKIHRLSEQDESLNDKVNK